MKTIWTGRVNQAAAKYGEYVPTATACCNTCRTCVQTNLLTAALTGIAAAGSLLARHLPRFAKLS